MAFLRYMFHRIRYFVLTSSSRIIGFYASGFVMIVISLDRSAAYIFEILKQLSFVGRLSATIFPISHRSNTKRTKVMLIIAWTLAPVCSIPQGFFFTVRSHPLVPTYLQCTPIGSFSSAQVVSIDFIETVIPASEDRYFRSSSTSYWCSRWPSSCRWWWCSGVTSLSSPWYTNAPAILINMVEPSELREWLARPGSRQSRWPGSWFLALSFAGPLTMAWLCRSSRWYYISTVYRVSTNNETRFLLYCSGNNNLTKFGHTLLKTDIHSFR